MGFSVSELRTELHNDVEALRLKLRAFSSRVAMANPHFAESDFDTHAADCLDAMREDLAGILDEADDALGKSEAADGYEPGEYPLAPSINPQFFAAE